MLHLLALLFFASSMSAAASEGGEPHRRPVTESVAADSVFFLVSGSLACDAFDPMMERFVRRSDVREFEGSRCTEGQIEMVVEFEFASESELTRWQFRKETRELLAPVFRELHPLRIQIRATPRDGSPCVSKNAPACAAASSSSRDPE